MSEETKKFQEAISDYFNYNKYGFTPEKGYWLLLVLYLVKSNAISLCNGKALTKSERSNLKVILHNALKDNNEAPLPAFKTCDCLIVNKPEIETKVQEIADTLGLNLDYNYHKNYTNTNLFLVWYKLCCISLLWYEENALWAFKEVYKKIEGLIRFGNTSQPKEITSLALNLLNPMDGDVYNPYSSSDILDYLQESKEKGFKSLYFLQNIDKKQCAIIKLAYLLCELDSNLVIDTDPINDWRGSIGFDYIISTPPWGVRSKDSECKISELDYLARSSRDTLHRSVGIYPASICYSKKSLEVIKELVENDWLESVILLPKNIFPQTSIESVVIVVNKKKEQKGEVRFIDASKCFISDKNRNILDLEKVLSMLRNTDNIDGVRIVESKSLKFHGWTIHPNAYTSVDKYTYPEGYTLVELGEILDRYEVRRIAANTEGYLVKTKHLNTSSLNCLEPLEKFEYTSDLIHAVRVEEPVILLSMTPGYLPTYCIASPEKPIYVNHGIKIFRLKRNCSWVLPEYLCYELSRRLKNHRKALPIDLFNAIFLQLKVAFPSRNLEEQKLVVKEAIQQLKLAQAKELGLQEVIESMKADYMNTIRMRKHDMRPHLTNLSSVGRMMRVYINQLNEKPEIQEKFSDLINEYQKSLDSLTNLVSVLSEEDKFGESEIIDINQYFKQLEESNDATISGYNLNYHIDINSLYESEILGEDCQDIGEHQNIPLYVDIARVDLERLITNIFENAKNHGFVDKESNNNFIRMILSFDSESDAFQIDFINNGNPLPEGMDKVRYGLRGEKAGKTGGTGNGGYIVKSITQHYKGDYDVFMDGDNTVIRVLLPISRESYE